MKPEYEFLRSAAITFMGSVILGAALLVGSGFFAGRMEQAYQRQRAQLHDTGQRYQAVAEEEKIIRDYLPQFVGLRETGIVGAEHRLHWIEVLQDAAAELQLPSLAYEISAQQPGVVELAAAPGTHRVFISRMTLNMQLLHEGDLFALFELLEARTKGLYRVASCELARNFTELAEDPVAANISAICVLEWFSIRPAGGLETNA